MDSLRNRFHRLLRWSERYTRTDMVYLMTNSFWINLNFLFTALFSFLLSIAFANLLTKTEYGTYQYLLSVASLLTAFTFTGFNIAITQSVARGYEGTFKASLRPQLLWNLVPAAAAFVWSGYYFLLGQPTLGIGVLIVGITLPILNTCNSYSAYLAGKTEFKRSSLYSVLGNAAYYACIFIGVIFFRNALPLVLINLLVTTATTAFFFFRTIQTSRIKNDVDPNAKPYAKHLSVMNVLSVIATQLDNLLVFHFLGAASLALYSIATLLPERLGAAFKSVIVASLPRFSERDLAEVRKNIIFRLALLIGATIVAAGGYALIAPLLFEVVYPAYGSAILYSQVYSLTFISFGASLVMSIFFAHRKVRELYILNVGAPLVQIVMQVVAIILWGLWGLIFAKILSSFLLSLIAVFLFYVFPDGKVAQYRA